LTIRSFLIVEMPRMMKWDSES